MKKIKLQSEYPCVLYIQGQQKYLKENEILELTDTDISIYPLDFKSVLPFKLDFTQYVTRNYRIIKYEDWLYCFLFSPIVISKKAIEKIKVAGTQLEILISKNLITIKNETEQIDLPIDIQKKDYICKPIQNFLVLYVGETLVIYNPKTKTLKTYKCDFLNFKNNELSFSQNLTTFAKTKISKKLIFKDDNFTETIESCENEKTYLQEECICYAFLECILNKNYTLAKEFLSFSFDNVQEKDFVDFFGRFYKFFPLSTTRFVLIYPQENKIINFKQDNNKIYDFEFDE